MIVNSADANRIEVTLTPEHLGKLTVEVTRGTDGTLSVVLHTTSERAANLLEKGVDGLRQALAPSNRGDVEVQVRPSEESQQQFLNPDGQNGQEQRQQQQQGRRREQQNAQDFLQQLRLGLVDVDGNET
ncbi:MAG: flagellar hook-length control protein FliK [Ruminococcaceae bacterium]|nr:flagellar hook-length control protein FliK [Oscillospiraceae bacterium]